MELTALTAAALAEKIQKKELTAKEAVQACLRQMRRLEPVLNSFVTIDEEGALAQAEEVQQKIDRGELTGPLAGVPIALKDNLCTEGMRTTCSSRMLEHFTPGYTAEAVQRLQKAGLIVLGKTNMDEFAMGSTTETSYFGATKNPWKLAHVPGGSSGGSCAAVAAEECFLALGSDTGGSIRQPSAFCGVTGLKPTYGTVSRYGLIAYGSSLDQIGPIARDVTDCALLLDVIAGWDAKDSTSIRRGYGSVGMKSRGYEGGGAKSRGYENGGAHSEGYGFAAALQAEEAAGADKRLKGLRIGIPRDYFGPGLDAAVKSSVLAAAQTLAGLGAEVEEFDLGLVDYAIPAYYVIASAEASSNLARFDGVKYGHRAEAYEGLHQMYKKTRSEGFGPEVKRRIMLGSFVLSSGYYDAYYLKALRTKALIKQEFDKAFARYDLILGPAAPTTAPRLGESLVDPIQMYLGDIYTVAVNLAGLPAISLPCGADPAGLPIGLQLIADCFEEGKLLRAAYALEQTHTYRRCPQAMTEETGAGPAAAGSERVERSERA